MSCGEKPVLQSQHEKPLDFAASQATSGSANPRYQSKSIKQLESESGKKTNSESPVSTRKGRKRMCPGERGHENENEIEVSIENLLIGSKVGRKYSFQNKYKSCNMYIAGKLMKYIFGCLFASM